MCANPRGEEYTTMRSHVTRAAVFALYQMSLLAGILLLPVALAARQVGITLPVHRVIERFNGAYETMESSDGRTA
jgi:hypothetical protein